MGFITWLSFIDCANFDWVTGLKLYFISTPFVGYNIILAIFFTLIERALPAHILSVLRGLVLIIPTAFLLSFLWKMAVVWFTYPATEAITALIGFVIYKKEDRREKSCLLYRLKRFIELIW